MVLLDKACVGHVIYHGVPFTTSSSRHSFAGRAVEEKKLPTVSGLGFLSREGSQGRAFLPSLSLKVLTFCETLLSRENGPAKEAPPACLPCFAVCCSMTTVRILRSMP